MAVKNIEICINTGTEYDTLYPKTLGSLVSGAVSSATTSASCTGNAATATSLATARTIRTNLASTSTASFNGTANITPGVTGLLAEANQAGFGVQVQKWIGTRTGDYSSSSFTLNFSSVSGKTGKLCLISDWSRYSVSVSNMYSNAVEHWPFFAITDVEDGTNPWLLKFTQVVTSLNTNKYVSNTTVTEKARPSSLYFVDSTGFTIRYIGCQDNGSIYWAILFYS